jgi:protein-S-isoprenylcysteine O-methyltransferase Ste14
LNDLVRRVVRFFSGTPRRTFLLYPGSVVALALVRGRPAPRRLWPLPLLAWGYLQYALTGKYRQRERAGSRGFASLPDKLLTSGPYAVTRNPMYLGHLIFLTGLALSWRSRLAWLYLIGSIPWFHMRVLRDERRLAERFGADYISYCRRVKRWLPFVL